MPVKLRVHIHQNANSYNDNDLTDHLLHLCVWDFLRQFLTTLHCLKLVGRTLAFRNV